MLVVPIHGTGKMLILAYDGIWDVLTNEQLFQKVEGYIAQGIDVKAAYMQAASDCLTTQLFSNPTRTTRCLSSPSSTATTRWPRPLLSPNKRPSPETVL